MQQPYLQFWFRKRMKFGSEKGRELALLEQTEERVSRSLGRDRAPGAERDLGSPHRGDGRQGLGAVRSASAARGWAGCRAAAQGMA